MPILDSRQLLEGNIIAAAQKNSYTHITPACPMHRV
jgi:hypothetical protein